MKNGSHKIDPKFFLSKLGSLISKERGTSFIVNKPQDSSGVFQFILTEIVKGCPDSFKMISSEVRDSSTCNSCLMSNTSLTLQTSILVPVTDSLVSSISSFLLENPKNQVENKFCHSCNCIKEFSLDRNFSILPDILIVNIDRNISIGSTQIKDDRRLNFSENLVLSCTCEDEISLRAQYSLKAVINHSGSFRSGHYTAHVKQANTWFFCNDTLVSKCKLSSCNPAYVSSLFFQRS